MLSWLSELVVAQLNVAIRWVLYLDLMLLFGLPAFHLYAPGSARASLGKAIPLKVWLVGLSLVGIVLSAIGLEVLCASMADMPLMSVDRATVMMVVNETPVGAAWKVRVAALTLSAISAVALANRPTRTISSSSFGFIALGSIAWAGHGASGEGTRGSIQLAADIVHLAAAGLWIGGLAAFCMLMFYPASRRDELFAQSTVAVLSRFAAAGTTAVAVLVVTGLVNSYMLIGFAGLPRLLSGHYGQLLAGKLILFAVMLALAAANRFRLTPALSRQRDSAETPVRFGALRRSISFETALALAVLLLVALMGTLSPPAAVS